MTPDDILHAVHVIQELRKQYYRSPIARRIEIDVVIEMYILCAQKTGAKDDVIFPGLDRNLAQTVLRGILGGRAGDAVTPYVLRDGWTAWNKPVPAPQAVEG